MGAARNLAIANQNSEIDESTARAVVASQRPRTALEAMAARLQVSASTLQNTLKSTVFSACRTNEEFVALVVVSNIYGLNPMLKEIYAFPAKGQGIVPMVSVDGWIRIMNEHPGFDGIEFDYHVDDKGKVEAIESIIYRKDRAHPIKVIEYLDECKRNTDPWTKSPRRMLRHRALMQGARVAFGFSGIAIEGEEAEFVDGGMIQNEAPVQALPSAQSLADELGDEIPDFDKSTGEVRDERGMTPVGEDVARELDAGQGGDFEQDFGLAGAEDSPADPNAAKLAKVRINLANTSTLAAINPIEAEYDKIRGGLSDEIAATVDAEFHAKRRALRKPAGDAGEGGQ